MNTHRHATALLAAVLAAGSSFSTAAEATIRVDLDKKLNRVTPYMTGACMEDVNHEIYGGIYSQMLFGESFQEPARIAGFTAYGGGWLVADGVLYADGGDGPKLVADDVRLPAGRVAVEVFFPRVPGDPVGNAGLIIGVDRPATGADNFVGYEISIDPQRQALVLGRHDNNWQHIADAPITVAADRWITLEVRAADGLLEAVVDGQSVLKRRVDPATLAGAVGLRTWQRLAKFRNFWIDAGTLQELAFEGPAHWAAGVSGMWHGVRAGSAAGSFALVPPQFFGDSPSQRLAFTAGAGAIGIENQGLNRSGLCFVADKPYEGRLWARSDKPTALYVALQSADGAKIYAEQQLVLEPGDWRLLDFVLTPTAADPQGRFAISLKEPGSVNIGYALLQPGAWGRFEGQPVRRDVAQAMIDQGLTVLRMGGLMANAPGYRWKQMLGPADRRPPYKGFWYPYSTNGWGVVELLNFCEAAGFLAIPDFNMDESPQDMADFVEYANGSPETPWGRRRSEDGHPAPYKLKYLELGNEEAVDDAYWQRFKPLAEAIWKKDPEIVLIVGDFEYREPIRDPYNFTGAPKITSLAAHKKILDLAKAHNRPVWFDVHIWNHEPRDAESRIDALATFVEALQRISPGADFGVCILEENALNHAVRRAVAHARTINGLIRMGDRVPIVCAANALQVDGQNDNGWDQGLLFLNPCSVWGQPPYYVTQMMSRAYLPQRVEAVVESPRSALDVVALASDDGSRLTLAVVNLEDQPSPTRIELGAMQLSQAAVEATQLAGGLDDVNTAAAPRRVVPYRADDRITISPDRPGVLRSTFPPYSVTTIQVDLR